MAALYLNRLFFRPRPTINRFGETLPPRPCLDSAMVRQNPSGGPLEICMSGCGMVGTANGPQVTVDGAVSPCICFEEDVLVAALPPGTGPRARVLVTYGPLVSGDFLIRTVPGARVRRWSIRIDDRIRARTPHR